MQVIKQQALWLEFSVGDASNTFTERESTSLLSDLTHCIRFLSHLVFCFFSLSFQCLNALSLPNFSFCFLCSFFFSFLSHPVSCFSQSSVYLNFLFFLRFLSHLGSFLFQLPVSASCVSCFPFFSFLCHPVSCSLSLMCTSISYFSYLSVSLSFLFVSISKFFQFPVYQFLTFLSFLSHTVTCFSQFPVSSLSQLTILPSFLSHFVSCIS